ncbi:DegT/DnrJ/EryC1/StrS family aminotransferase [Streptomyces griseoviridis]|uniref:3-amino-5-hydroxybenzoate synthase n=3 Tax=Streptomyces TaxID=1883 RepID=A0A918LI80_STRGD|nr:MULTISPECIES: DegT/DnrJ/EryC1/StrS family aminotransferase [Streptomyces]MDP9680234.1 3-amino-5-hydroxybenzoate synthase [Streptomyces griseoviridis]GGS50277.1 3-amino-5-hydroxybenzoate synthase [Streptomyces niveoruber]GGT13634.1 3-amino-5-hydroxybenzoate synthase [Streptomyces griseoviridis]GGU48652.1 3-amino-5-hydroxybenzoate synthase [Streptomyces daghestanicus]GHI29251.1 3-amino-5-hydroxybenzoate synthase [Streptomyces daghestanicus]
MSISRDVPEFPAWPQFDDAERVNLLRALEQGQWWRMGGSEVTEFEREFAEYHGAEHALAVTNGTHALELALQVLGVGPGTEVIVPAFTFISSSQAAQRLGAVAVPVDIDPGTFCIDPAAVERAIGPRTAAIMPVHMAGHIADMDALEKLSADSGVPLIQDAAHAHGARWQGRRVGEFPSVAAFSFQNGKLMTAGEGGAVLFPEGEQYEQAFLRHSCGRPPADRGYFHQTSGSNFRMNELSAAVLRAQLGRLDGQISLREERAPLLTRLLDQIDGVTAQSRDERCDRNPHYMMMFRLPGITEERRNALVDKLIARGVPAFAAFRAIYRCPGFWETGAPELSVDELAARCPTTEAVHQDTIWLHHRTLLGTEEQMHRIADVVADTLATA